MKLLPTVYIAGPMTGYPEYNRPAFHAKEAELKELGYCVLSPANLPDGMTVPQYMNIDIAMLQQCNYIYMLEGWEDSKGANAELTIAKSLNIDVLSEGKLWLDRVDVWFDE